MPTIAFAFLILYSLATCLYLSSLTIVILSLPYSFSNLSITTLPLIKDFSSKSPLSYIGMSSIKRTSVSCFNVRLAISIISSSLKPPINTELILILSKPTDNASSIPARASLSSPTLVIYLYLSALRVSKLIFNLSTPASFKSLAYCLSNKPFVVMQSSFIPGTCFILEASLMISFLISGSPPVSLTFFMPSLAATFTAVIISS